MVANITVDERGIVIVGVDMHNFKIKPLGNNGYEVYIDDKKVRPRMVDVNLEVGSYPEVKIEMAADCDLEVDGLIDLTENEIYRLIAKRLDNREFCDKVWRMIAER